MRFGGLLITGLGLLLLSAADPVLPQDAPLADRAEYFAAVADGALTGDALVEAQIERIKQEIHYVQLEIERYAVDHSKERYPGSVYPYSINELVVPQPYKDGTRAYALPGIYPNPITADGPEDLSAVCVPFGWDELSPGNFSYLTAYDEEGIVRDYVLVAYGPTRDSKYDLDGDGLPEGVILINTSGELDWDNPPPMYDGGRIVDFGIRQLAQGEVVAGPAEEPAQATGSGEMGLDYLVTKSKEAKVKQNGHMVQLALERWAVDHEFYPQSVNQLVMPLTNEDGRVFTPYIEPGFADNPFDDAEENGMMCIPLGWSSRAPGNVSYLTQHDAEGNVFGYQLVCYGLDPDDGMDIDDDGELDGVILYLGSGMWIESLPDDPEAFEYYDSGRTVVIR